MSPIVIDTSIAVTWCFGDEQSAATDALLERVRDEGAVVPGLWHLEVGNVLLQAEKRRRVAAGDVTTLVEVLAALPIVVDHETPYRALRETLAVARSHTLTTYNAGYLELAMRRGLPLATKDEPLAEAARRMGVTVLP